MDGIINAINDFFRGILFSFAQCFLFIFDVVWECVKRIITLDLSSNLLQWFMLIVTFIFMFLIFRITKIFIKNMFDEEYRMRFNIGQFLIKIMLASFAIGFTPIAFSYVSQTTSQLIGHIEYFIPSEDQNIKNLTPSKILLQVGRIDTSDISADLTPEIDVSADNFDINAKDENDNYIYFSTYTSLFLLIVESIAGCFIFVMIAIMVAQRFFAIAYKYLLAPYPISGLIDNEDKSFSTWMKMILGDFMMNFAQVYGVYLTIYLCNNASIQRALGNDVIGICAKIIFFLAGLLAIMNLPSIIATIIGGHGAGVMQSLQEMKSMMTMSKTATAGVAGATVGIGMGIAGGAIAGASNGYTQSSGSFKSKMANGVASGVSGAMKGGMNTAGKHFSGGRIGGGLSTGAGILKDGISTAKSNFGSSGGSSEISGYGDNQNNISKGNNQSKNHNGITASKQNVAFGSITKDNQASPIKIGIDSANPHSTDDYSMHMQDSGASHSNWDGTNEASSFQSAKEPEENDIQSSAQSFDQSVFSPSTTEHSTINSGEQVYSNTLKSRLNPQHSNAKLNGEPLNKEIIKKGKLK